MKLITVSPFGAPSIKVLLDHDIAYSLPIENQALGTEYHVMDNLDLGQTVSITGLFGSGLSVFQVSGVSGWGKRFTWGGGFYVVE